MIEVRQLCKTFTVHRKDPGLWGSVRSLLRRQRLPKHAVRDVSFDVGEGEIVGLIGANGAGKTTLVKMLAGIIHPSAGAARVLGFTPAERDNRFRRQIALIMGQKAQLWWDLPAADCFLLLREIYQIPQAEYKNNLEYLAQVLGVGDEMNVQIRRLSLGERMKMELIAALLHRPRVVFLDEPTIGLDLTTQRSIRDFLLRYRAEHRPAMLLTSHYMEDIERLCRRIIILRDGEIVYDGSLQRVVEHYARHKVLTLHLRKETQLQQATPNIDPEFLRRLGEIEELNDVTLRLRVRRDAVAESAAELLTRLPVADIAIEEPDIGSIIEAIMLDRGIDRDIDREQVETSSRDREVE